MIKKIGEKLPFGLRCAKIGMERAPKDLDFQMGASLVLKARIVIASNWYNKTSPAAKRDYPFPEMSHAEFRLFNHALLENTPIKGTVYVYRLLADGTTGLAKPCDACWNLLQRLGIKRIIYTLYNNQYEEVKL